MRLARAPDANIEDPCGVGIAEGRQRSGIGPEQQAGEAGGEDIVVFEYVKKNNRETGPALVGIELEQAGDLEGLLERMDRSPLQIEQVPAGSPLFTFLT